MVEGKFNSGISVQELKQISYFAQMDNNVYKLFESIITGDMKCLQEDRLTKILDLKTPLKKSVQMLRALIKFWHVKSYQEFLSKEFIA